MYAEWPRLFLIYLKKLVLVYAYMRTVVNFTRVPVVYARSSGTSASDLVFPRRCYVLERKCF